MYNIMDIRRTGLPPDDSELAQTHRRIRGIREEETEMPQIYYDMKNL